MTTTSDEPSVEDSRARPQGRPRETLIAILERYALVILLLALVVMFSVLPATGGNFATLTNGRVIVANESVVAIVAIAALVPLVCHRFDVSVGSMVSFVAVVVAKLMTETGLPLAVTMLAGPLLGLMVGLISGFVIAHFRAHSLVITLGMATALEGLSALVSADATILGIPDSLMGFGSSSFLGIPKPALVLLVVALTIGYVMRYTIFGRQLLSIGTNDVAARRVGIPVTRSVLIAFGLSGAISGLAAVLLLSRTGSAVAGMGDGYTLPALAAAFLGSTTIRPGRFTVLGTMIGVFFVAISVNGLTLAGAQSWVDPVFNGVAVVVAVTVSAILVRRQGGART